MNLPFPPFVEFKMILLYDSSLKFSTNNEQEGNMILSRKDVVHVALLARLELSDEEIETYTKQLNQILDYFRKLQELNTESVPPTSHAVPMQAVLREDVQKISGVTDDALSQAPAQTNNLFLVPKIID